MDCADLPDYYNFLKIGYCGCSTFPYAHIKLGQATKLILSHFQEEYNPFILDTLKNKKTQLVLLYFVYGPNKNISRTDLTNDDQNDYAFAPTYGDGSTAFRRHIISVVVFFYSNTLQIILVDYTVTYIGCFDDNLYTAPLAKTMRVNGITNFILYVARCITFNQKKLLQQHLLLRHI